MYFAPSSSYNPTVCNGPSRVTIAYTVIYACELCGVFLVVDFFIQF